MTLEIVIASAVNLVGTIAGIGFAYGRIRGRLDSLEKAERELRAEIILTRERVHEFGNRMGTLVLEIVKLRNGPAK